MKADPPDHLPLGLFDSFKGRGGINHPGISTRPVASTTAHLHPLR